MDFLNKQQALDIAKKMKGNRTRAVKEIEKLQIGLSKDPDVAKALKEDTDNERLANLRIKQMMKQTQIRDLDPTKDADKITMKKNDIENIQIRMDAIRDKMQKEMLELIDEEIKFSSPPIIVLNFASSDIKAECPVSILFLLPPNIIEAD